MKVLFNFLTTGILFILLTVQASGQAKIANPVHILDMDIAIENLKVVSTGNSPCEKNKVFISFVIRNKKQYTNAMATIDFLVNSNPAEFSHSPIPGNQSCYVIPPNASITVTANAEIKASWITLQQATITVRAKVCNIDNGSIQFREAITSDNSKDINANFSGTPIPQNNYCICSIQNNLIDTSFVYIIQGSIKTNNSGSQTAAATLAVANNTYAVLSREYAGTFKFKFCGYHNSNNTIPMYNIVHTTTLYYLTKASSFTGDLLFAQNSGADTQKWILRQNNNGSYAIFNAGGSSTSCTAIGRTAGLVPTQQQPYLKFYSLYDPANQFQQFQLIKIQ